MFVTYIQNHFKFISPLTLVSDLQSDRQLVSANPQLGFAWTEWLSSHPKTNFIFYPPVSEVSREVANLT